MANDDASVDRRLFLGGSAVTLLAVADGALPQQPQAPKPAEPDARKLTQVLAQYIAGFDLKNVPQPVIDRARLVFIDTIGVMLAGSHEEVAHIVREMVKAEAAAPAASVVGQSLRTSPQLAALPNGVASHAMDYDLN